MSAANYSTIRRMALTEDSICTVKRCTEKAIWWIIRTIDGEDIDYAVCDEHAF